MTFPTPRTALMGNPPKPDHEPRKFDLVSVLEQMQAIAAVQMLKDFHGAPGDLPPSGNDVGDKRAVLATEGDGGGVYRWTGSEWDLIAALPAILGESVFADLAEAWATGTEPGGTGTKSAREWAESIPSLSGWSPILAAVSDGERRVLRVDDWTGGEGTKPATGDYIGASGLVSDIAQAVDIRGGEGPAGPQGDGLRILGSLADPSELPGSADPGDGYLIDGDLYVWDGSGWENVGSIQGPQGDQGGQGDQGDSGDDGWSPVLAVVSDDDRRVLQVSDWVGGEGSKPATGDYVGASGLTPTIGDAVDIRGPAGAGTGDLLAANNLSDLDDAETARSNLGLATVAATGVYSDLSGLPSLFDGHYSSLSGVPFTFPPEAHTHTLSEISDSGDAAALNVGATSGTVAAGDHGHAVATDTTPGFMSATDKARLDGLEGGDEGQVLAKASNADFDFEWIENGGGAGSELTEAQASNPDGEDFGSINGRLLASAIGGYQPKGDIDSFDFEWLAHRAAPQINPEMSVASFRECLNRGFPLLEMDARLSSDGSVVLFHDVTLNRVTDSSGDVSSRNLGDLRSISVQGFGSGLGAQPISSLVDVLQAFGNRACYIIEAKVDCVSKIIAALEAHSIPKNRVVIASFNLTWLAPAVAMGYTTEALFPATSSTGTASTNLSNAEAAGVDRIGVSQDSSDAVISNYTASDFPVAAYTASRRVERNRLVGLGVDGIYSDDPAYSSADEPLHSEDRYAAGAWMPGMFAVGMSLSDVSRGRLFDGGWGWDTGFQPDTTESAAVLQGWACPAIDDPSQDTLIVEYSAKYISDSSDTRWGGLLLADSSMLDAEVVDGPSSPSSEKLMSFFCRRNGSLEIFKRDGTTATNLATQSTPSISLGSTQHFRVTITPTSAQLERLDGPGGSATHTASTSDTDVRGAYFHLAVNRAAVLFSRVKVNPS